MYINDYLPHCCSYNGEIVKLFIQREDGDGKTEKKGKKNVNTRTG